MLAHLILEQNWYQVLVFTRTKHGADRLVKQLGETRIPALAIHGNKSQAARTRALAKFKDGSLQVLVATDIAARGIDIIELAQVVNFDLPNVPEDYVHRIGRTGRAGSTGEAISLVCVDEYKLLSDIEKLIKQNLSRESVAGFEVDPQIKAEPIQMGRSQQSRGQRSGSRPEHRSDRGRSERTRPVAQSASQPPKPATRIAQNAEGEHSSAPRRAARHR